MKKQKNSTDNEIQLSSKNLDNIKIISSINFDIITKIDLSNNYISDLPADFKNFINLETLLLNSNEFTKIPKCIFEINTLKILDMDNNEISDIPADFEKLSNLTNLLLSHMEISKFPIILIKCKKLKILDLSYNEIASIPSEIGELTELIELDLNFNNINSISDEINKLKKLKNIKLSNNKLKELSDALLSQLLLINSSGHVEIQSNEINLKFHQNEIIKTYSNVNNLRNKLLAYELIDQSKQLFKPIKE